MLPALGQVRSIDKEDVDLAQPEGLRAIIRSTKPRLIVNATAYTAVDQAEKEPEVAMAVNGTAPRVMAEEAARLDALLVHYSTDYVFDGRKSGPYVETDVPQPLNAYGRSKLAGEQAVQAVCPAHLIFRTSWLYDSRGRNFLLTMLKLAREKEELRVVSDQHGAPTRAKDLAEATVRVVRDGQVKGLTGRHGLYHLTNAGRTSWHGFTEAIVAEERARAGGSNELKVKRILPIATSDYPTPAVRPANSSLDCGKFERNFGFGLPDWRTSLHQAVAEVAA
jgi:dTDP-4-dehydrorhamnose reductase